jgi:hypothetical protein
LLNDVDLSLRLFRSFRNQSKFNLAIVFFVVYHVVRNESNTKDTIYDEHIIDKSH